MSPSETPFGAILSEFQKVLRETYHFKWDAGCGTPPARCYVEQVTEARNRTNQRMLVRVGAWMVTLDSIAPTPIEKLPPPKTDGMFFDLCRGSFSISPDGKMASISWSMGPRFGRVIRHSVNKDAEGVLTLGAGECVLVS